MESKIESQIIQVLKKTSIVGILALLASLVLQGRPTRGSSIPPTLPATVFCVILHISLKLLLLFVFFFFFFFFDFQLDMVSDFQFSESAQ